MTGVDTAWARGELREFLLISAHVPYPNSPGSGVVRFGSHQRGSDYEVAGRAHVVEQILDRVLTGSRTRPDPMREPGPTARWGQLRELAGRAMTQLEREDNLRSKLGDGAPHLDAGRMHP